MSATRQGFDRDLLELKQNILKLGDMVKSAIISSVKALASQDAEMAQAVIDGDNQINIMASQIEEKCMMLIATQQPMAKDLRKINTGIRIIIDLERMADHATGIARIARDISGENLVKPLIDIPAMARLAEQMVNDILIAFVNNDVSAAMKVSKMDDEIDHRYKNIYNDLEIIMKTNASASTQAAKLLFVSYYLERIADHVTNISEGIIYTETGDKPSLNE